MNDVLKILIVIMGLVLVRAGMLDSFEEGVHEGREQGYKKGWVEGHEKRLMQDMERICI